MPGFKILFIGGASLELATNMYKLPEAGEYITDDGGVAYIPGGDAASAACAAQKMGADSILCANLGRDIHGQQLFSYYKETGIDHSFIKVDRDLPTGFTLVIKETSESARRINYPGANVSLSQEAVIDAVNASPDAVYITLEVPFQVAATAARAANAKGIPVFMEASPASKDYPLEDLPPIEIFILDAEEAKEYTDELPMGSAASLRAALALTKRVECKYLVIKQGSRGSFLYDGKHYQMQASLRLDKTQDTAGVGGVFSAALVLEYLRSKFDINTAIKYATAAAAIFVTRQGQSSGVPTDEEVMEAYNDFLT